MLTIKQLKEDLPVINKLHIGRSTSGTLLIQKKPSQEEMQQTIQYIRENTVLAREGRKCVDGRYPPDTARGMLARAGGDCGYVMALMAINQKKKLELTPEQCFNAVYKVISGKMHGAFCIHTDHHADPEHEGAANIMHTTLIGCGHLAKAAKTQWNLRRPYDVPGKDVQKIIAYAKNLADISDHVEMVNLEGEHAEQGVLIIDDTAHTVNAMDSKRREMYFIYDRKRDEAFMKKLVEVMAIPGVTFEDMKKESDIQLQATLHNLAKGLPVYTVIYKAKEPQVAYLATIN
jgi:hypothetical protein